MDNCSTGCLVFCHGALEMKDNISPSGELMYLYSVQNYRNVKDNIKVVWLLGLCRPSSSFTKELHDSVLPIAWKIEELQKVSFDAIVLNCIQSFDATIQVYKSLTLNDERIDVETMPYV